MKSFYLIPEYLEDVQTISLPFDVNLFRNKTFLISGSTGMIGSYLIDYLMSLNKRYGYNVKVYAISRDREKVTNRFDGKFIDQYLFPVEQDVNISFDNQKEIPSFDYCLHLASNTHPLQYSNDPIGTIESNVIGLKNMLDFAYEHKAKRFLFASSVEIYGQNRGDTERFNEDYLGYINCNTLRAGYPESKRVGEALCQAYISQKGMDIVIPRLSRVYGPTMLWSDSKAIAQFLKNGVNKEKIVLKSAGNQLFSYTYVGDAVSALLTCLIKGGKGEAYNISDRHSEITLKDLATLIAKTSGTEIDYALPDVTEAKGYSTATKALLDSTKLEEIGWVAKSPIEIGISKTLHIVKELKR